MLSSLQVPLWTAPSKLSYTLRSSGSLEPPSPFFLSRLLTQARSLWINQTKDMLLVNKKELLKLTRKSLKKRNLFLLLKTPVLTTESLTCEYLLTKRSSDSNLVFASYSESTFTAMVLLKFTHPKCLEELLKVVLTSSAWNIWKVLSMKSLLASLRVLNSTSKWLSVVI